MSFSKRNIAISAVVILIPVLVVAWWLLSPLFTSKTVDEQFPLSKSAVVPVNMERKDVEMVMARMAEMGEQVDEPMMSMEDSRPDADEMAEMMDSPMMGTVANTAAAGAAEDLSKDMASYMPEGLPATTEQVMVQVMANRIKENLEEAMTEAMVQPPADPPAPVSLKQGAFTDADRFHKGSGQATIYQLPDGSHILRLENLDVTNGPDLRVILSPSQNPESSGEVKGQGYVELDKLKGNKGNQNYPIPAGFDVAPIQSVVIYCKPFKVIFSVASLQQAG